MLIKLTVLREINPASGSGDDNIEEGRYKLVFHLFYVG